MITSSQFRRKRSLGSDADAEAVGEGIAIGFPGWNEANQEPGDEDAAEVDPASDGGGLDGDVKPELLLDNRLEDYAETVNHDDAESAAGEGKQTTFEN